MTPRAAAWRRLLRSGLTVAGGLVVAALALTALLAPWIVPYPPDEQYRDHALEPPSARHPFGTDTIGRDNLSRLIYGARISLFAAVSAISLAAAAGVTLGLCAGYYVGPADAVIGRFFDALLAFPAVLLAIFIVAVLGPSIVNAVIAVAIVYIPTFGRLTRASVLALRVREFVEAARALGATDRRLIVRHILPNSLSPVIVQFSLGVGYAMLVEASLSFLGLGVQPPTPSWGSMIGFGRNYLTQAPWLATFPGLAILVAVLGINLFGDGLRDLLDPRHARVEAP